MKKNKKVYAKQVCPEIQESPYYLFGADDCYYGDITITGNRDFKGRKTEAFMMIEKNLEDLSSTLLAPDLCGYDSATQAIMDMLPPEHKAKYSSREVSLWKKIAAEYDKLDYGIGNAGADEVVCEALRLITGRPHERSTLRGCSQGDWQNVYYPAEYNKGAFLSNLEADYFNTGTEVVICEYYQDDALNENGLRPPERICDEETYSMYCYGWNDALIKQEIAESTGRDVSDVIFYKHDGYTKTARYIVA